MINILVFIILMSLSFVVLFKLLSIVGVIPFIIYKNHGSDACIMPQPKKRSKMMNK